MNQVVVYKNKVASRYIPLVKELIPLRIRETGKYWVSEKHDGHFAVLHVVNGKAAFYNRNGKKLEPQALIQEAEVLFAGKNVMIAGELYVVDPTKRTRSYQVTTALSEGSPNLLFAAYDIIEDDGKPYVKPTDQVLEKIEEWLGKGTLIRPVQHTQVAEAAEIIKLYEEIVEGKGSEGLVVRTAEAATFKIKKRHHLDAVVLGYTEGEDDRAGMMRDVLVGLRREDNTIQVLGKVGTGYSEEQRVKFLHQLSKMHVESEYIEIAEGALAFQMVKPQLIFEISCLDLVAEFAGKTVRKMILDYNDKEGYRPVQLQAFVSVINPVFERVREDKTDSSEDTGITQVTREVEIPADDQKVKNLGKSELIRREVYIKETKGEKAVRKFVAWKTNKEESLQYPAYVMVYTDYSPNRKEILDQEVKVASSEQELNEVFDAALIENIKKGWNRA